MANGCVERFDIPSIDNNPVIVVDGLLTDLPGPYTVNLFRSSPLDQDLDVREGVSGATVTISDDAGITDVLQEALPGVYKTAEDGIRGVLGRKYQLRIVTGEGNIYESEWATLTPAGEISDLFFEFLENDINPTEPTRPQDAFQVSLNTTGTEGAPNLFRWRWTGIFHVKTYPELRTRIIKEDNIPVIVPDPIPCSGYVVDQTGNLAIAFPCECCDCYVHEYSNDVLLSSNSFVTGQEFNNVNISKVPVDKWRFYEKYYIEVEQLSVSEAVYDFWRVVKQQQQGAGDIFQPNVVKIRGNIRSISNPDEEVFGIFSVSAVTKKSIFIHRTDVPKRVAQIDTVIADCRHAFFNSSNQKPPFW